MSAARFAPLAAIVALLALAGPSSASAQTLGTHPALGRGAAPAPAQIDPNTFIVAHPAGLALRAGHANHAHPADVLSQSARGIDANHFLVQPPASVHWALAPAAETLAVAATR